MTKVKPGDPGEGTQFSSVDEVIVAYNNEKVGLHARVKVRINGELIETTTGRVIFNKSVPDGLGFINELLSKKSLTEIVARCYLMHGNRIAAKFLDDLKELGFKFAMRSGVSISLSDVLSPKEKDILIVKAQSEVDNIQKQFMRGIITDGERYNKIIDIWTHVTGEVAEIMFLKLSQAEHGFNPLYMMSDSGARGSKEQIRQLAGMRGLMAKHIIRSNR